MSEVTPGILINREPPITVGFCGNDNCEHLSHKAKRSAQAAADTRRKKREGKGKDANTGK